MPSMQYRDRAVAAIEAGAQDLRNELKAIILEAINTENYGDVASIARISTALSSFAQSVRTEAPPGDIGSNASAENLSEFVRSAAQPTEEEDKPLKLSLRGHSRREKYPQFLKDGDRLVKVAWSKKDRAPYEHRAPFSVVNALIAAVRETKGEGKVFQAIDVLPLMKPHGEEYPSYQSYLALNWLREAGVISKKGREGYLLKAKAASAQKLEQLWAALSVAQANE